MSKYTPEVTSGGYTGRIIDENGDTVAIVNNYEQAILMASAPELLEALKALYDMPDERSIHDISDEEIDLWMRAKAVINKAEGKL